LNRNRISSAHAPASSRAGDQDPAGPTAPGQLQQDQPRLDRLAQAYVVGHQEPDPRLAQPGQYRFPLVRLHINPPVLNRQQITAAVRHRQRQRAAQLAEVHRVADLEPQRGRRLGVERRLHRPQHGQPARPGPLIGKPQIKESAFAGPRTSSISDSRPRSRTRIPRS